MVAGPFAGGRAEEIYLPRAPLVLALAQVRFPKLPSLLADDSVERIQQKLDGTFPVRRDEFEPAGLVIVQGAGVTPPPPMMQKLVRFLSRDGSWKFSVGDSFVALDTVKYESRTDFCARLEECIQAVVEVAAPVFADRVGLRYVDQLRGEQLGRLEELVNPPLLGITPNDVDPARILLSLNQARLELHDHEMTIRSGWIPSDFVIDPTVPPLNEQSWVLDIDTYSTKQSDFSPLAIATQMREFSEDAYEVFRWAATRTLISWAGGDAGE